MPRKMHVKSIKITRAEGPSALCGISELAQTWEGAEEVLTRWSETVQARIGYDKCDFVVTFDDDDTYTGTFDLYHTSVAKNLSLKKHIGDYCRFSANLMRPEHFSDGMWAQAQISHTSFAEDYKKFIEGYDV